MLKHWPLLKLWRHRVSGQRNRPQNIPQTRVLQQGDTIATALLRQHLLASGIISVPTGQQHIPKSVRGNTLSGLRTAGTDACGLLSFAGDRAAGIASARGSTVGFEHPRDSHSAVIFKCLTKGPHYDVGQEQCEDEIEVLGRSEAGSIGARVARASRQGLPGGKSLADLISPVACDVLSPAGHTLPRDTRRSTMDLGMASPSPSLPGHSRCQRLGGLIYLFWRLPCSAACCMSDTCALFELCLAGWHCEGGTVVLMARIKHVLAQSWAELVLCACSWCDT